MNEWRLVPSPAIVLSATGQDQDKRNKGLIHTGILTFLIETSGRGNQLTEFWTGDYGSFGHEFEACIRI